MSTFSREEFVTSIFHHPLGSIDEYFVLQAAVVACPLWPANVNAAAEVAVNICLAHDSRFAAYEKAGLLAAAKSVHQDNQSYLHLSFQPIT